MEITLKDTEENKVLIEVYTQAQEKAKEIVEKYKPNGKTLHSVEVCVVVDENGENPKIAYFQPATTKTKMACTDISMRSYSDACANYYSLCCIQEYTDPVFSERDTANDFYYLEALEWCGAHIRKASASVKKK